MCPQHAGLVRSLRAAGRGLGGPKEDKGPERGREEPSFSAEGMTVVRPLQTGQSHTQLFCPVGLGPPCEAGAPCDQ